MQTRPSNVIEHPGSLAWLTAQLKTLQRDVENIYAHWNEPAIAADEAKTANARFREDQKFAMFKLEQKASDARGYATKLFAVSVLWNIVVTLGLLATWLVV
jgi:hypothetical protein